MPKAWLQSGPYGQELKQKSGKLKQLKKGNPPGTGAKEGRRPLPPTMSGFGYTGKTTQLQNGKIVSQKKSER